MSGSNSHLRNPVFQRLPASSQGEHIFNALGNLASELHNLLIASINASGSPGRRIAAAEALRQLQEHAAALILERDRGDFRTGPHGDIRNADRYSGFSNETRTAIRAIISQDPASHTLGYTNINRLLAHLDFYTIDMEAHRTAREQLARPNQFDEWFHRTRELMYATFNTLRDAALAVHRTHLDEAGV